jgi:hypothetical protein
MPQVRICDDMLEQSLNQQFSTFINNLIYVNCIVRVLKENLK